MISIITVVKNDHSNIERTIKSVVHQKSSKVEYIVIDGGSTDGTLQIIDQYGDYIDHFVSESDRGIFDALNKGVQLATGRFIGICHSGDWLEDQILKKTINFLESTQIFILTGKIKYWKTDQDFIVKNTAPLNKIKIYSSIFHTATFIRSDLFKTHGQYSLDYAICSDYHWLLNVYLSDVKFTFWNEVISNFKGGGLSDTHLLQTYRENFIIQKSLLKDITDQFRSFRIFLIRLTIYWPLISIKQLCISIFSRKIF